MQLYQRLQQIFRYHINSNDEIPRFISTLASIGKLDEPKKNLLLIEALSRIAKLEELVEGFQQPSVPTITTSGSMPLEVLIQPNPANEKIPWVGGLEDLTESEVSWQEVRHKAKELGVFKPGLKRTELEALIASKM